MVVGELLCDRLRCRLLVGMVNLSREDDVDGRFGTLAMWLALCDTLARQEPFEAASREGFGEASLSAVVGVAPLFHEQGQVSKFVWRSGRAANHTPQSRFLHFDLFE